MAKPRKLEQTIDAPAPQGGRARRIKLPNDWRGIQYEIGRMGAQIKEQYANPEIIDCARQVAGRWVRFVEDQMARRGEPYRVGNSQAVRLEGIDIWCRHHFVYCNDPNDKEVIQTPVRELRQTKLGSEFVNMLMEPFYREIEAQNSEFDRQAYQPPPLFVGDCDEALTLLLSMASALGMRPIKFIFGATGDQIHHVWGQVTADGETYDIDLTDPAYKLGDRGAYDYTEEYEIFGAAK